MGGNRRSARLAEAEAAATTHRLKRREPEPVNEAEVSEMAGPSSSAPELCVSEKEIAAAHAARQRLYGNSSPKVFRHSLEPGPRSPEPYLVCLALPRVECSVRRAGGES